MQRSGCSFKYFITASAATPMLIPAAGQILRVPCIE